MNERLQFMVHYYARGEYDAIPAPPGKKKAGATAETDMLPL
jgi:hypothetical protein